MKYHGVYGAMCATAAGRESLASQLKALADRNGWTTESESAGLNPREISVTMWRGAYAVTVHLTGGDKSGVFMGHWHTRYQGVRFPAESPADIPPCAEYPAGFAGAAPNSAQGLSSRPHHKATAAAENWRPFLAQLEAGMAEINARVALEIAA